MNGRERIDGMAIRYGILKLCLEARQTAQEHGFEAWTGDRLPVGLMLLVTEVAEVCDEFRRTQPGTDMMTSQFYEEMADVIIRWADIIAAQPNGTAHICRALEEKLEKNRERPYKHGGKRI